MAEVTDERLAFLIGAPDWENTHLGDEVEAALTELQARRAAEAKAVEVDLPDYLRFGEPDMFPPAQK